MLYAPAEHPGSTIRSPFILSQHHRMLATPYNPVWVAFNYALKQAQAGNPNLVTPPGELPYYDSDRFAFITLDQHLEMSVELGLGTGQLIFDIIDDFKPDDQYFLNLFGCTIPDLCLKFHLRPLFGDPWLHFPTVELIAPSNNILF